MYFRFTNYDENFSYKKKLKIYNFYFIKMANLFLDSNKE